MLSHEEAIARDWTQKYVLGELPEPERMRFEEHFFNCQSCADKIRMAHLLVKGVETTFYSDFPQQRQSIPVPLMRNNNQRPGRWRLAVGLPYAAIVLLSLGVGLQFSALRSARSPQTLVAFAIPPQTKGEYYQVQLPIHGEFVEFEVDLLETAPRYIWTIRLAGTNQPLIRNEARQEASAGILKLLLPVHALKPGRYNLAVRGESGREFLYLFEIK